METILLVEDDPRLGPLLVMLLRQGGHQNVLLADDAPEARELARAHADDLSLLVVDQGLPSQRGDALARDLASRQVLGVVLISGYPIEGSPRSPRVEPSWTVLQKPFTAEQLLAAVTAATTAAAT